MYCRSGNGHLHCYCMFPGWLDILQICPMILHSSRCKVFHQQWPAFNQKGWLCRGWLIVLHVFFCGYAPIRSTKTRNEKIKIKGKTPKTICKLYQPYLKSNQNLFICSIRVPWRTFAFHCWVGVGRSKVDAFFVGQTLAPRNKTQQWPKQPWSFIYLVYIGDYFTKLFSWYFLPQQSLLVVFFDWTPGCNSSKYPVTLFIGGRFTKPLWDHSLHGNLRGNQLGKISILDEFRSDDWCHAIIFQGMAWINPKPFMYGP